MKNKVSIFIIIFTSFITFSCTEIIDLELNEGDNLKIIVDAWLDNSGRQQKINLSLSRDFYDNESSGVAIGAVVSVQSSTETYTFTESTNGEYLMDQLFNGVIGETYTLTIEYQGVTYTATHAMSRIAELENINYVFFESAEEDEEDVLNPVINPDSLDEWDIYVTFQEPAGKGDYYYFGNYLKSRGPETNLYLGDYFDDELLDGVYIDNEYATYGFYEPGDTIVTQMFSISEEFHDYLFAVDNQTDFRGFIFDAPPANVPTNISNGGRGFFVVSAVSEFEKVLE